MFSPEVASLLSECTVVADNARSPIHSVTESVEQLPPLRPAGKIKLKKRKSKNLSGRTFPVVPPAYYCRWTSSPDVKRKSLGMVGSLPSPNISISNDSTSTDRITSPGLTPPRRLESLAKVLASPKRPERKISASDLSPRKPQRTLESSLSLAGSNSNATTAQLLRDALSICDLSGDDDDERMSSPKTVTLPF